MVIKLTVQKLEHRTKVCLWNYVTVLSQNRSRCMEKLSQSKGEASEKVCHVLYKISSFDWNILSFSSLSKAPINSESWVKHPLILSLEWNTHCHWFWALSLHETLIESNNQRCRGWARPAGLSIERVRKGFTVNQSGYGLPALSQVMVYLYCKSGHGLPVL